MTLDATRVLTMIRKELREYRRNRFIMYTMAFTPLIFLVAPTIDIFAVRASAPSAVLDKRIGLSLLFMTIIPAIIPAALAAYSVVGEREQGTLEPVLTTPIRQEEFVIGKALAALIPSVVISYVVFGTFLLCVRLFAHLSVVSAVFQGPHLIAQVLFTPLLATWAIWAGIGVSVRASDVRIAQQLGMLVSLPPVAITALMSFGLLQPTFTLALELAAALVVIDVSAWRVVSAMFNRERLITGSTVAHWTL